MTVPAREALTVFIEGEETPGIILYAFFGQKKKGSTVEFPSTLWEESQVAEFKLHGKSWTVMGWNVAIHRWPEADAWDVTLFETLKYLIDSGASVAWLGAEGSPYSDPPDLFDPRTMSGGVLAGMTADHIFLSAVHPERPVRALSDEELLLLRRHAEAFLP